MFPLSCFVGGWSCIAQQEVTRGTRGTCCCISNKCQSFVLQSKTPAY